MKAYFELFAGLIEKVKNITNSSSGYDSTIDPILDAMEELTKITNSLSEQKKDIPFYRDNIRRFFQKDVSESVKYDYYSQLKKEYESLKDFAIQHGFINKS